MKKLNAIDLFSGAGGLSEGFLETKKFNFLAHVEWETPMVDTLRNNLIKRWGYSSEEALKRVIQFDIQKTDELMHGNWNKETIENFGNRNHAIVIKKGLDGIIKNKQVDIIIGGPPCQAYSIAGRAQDPNLMKNDYRNYLFESFVKVVNNYKPKLFVFENVPGILSAMPGDKLVIERIYEAFEDIGYEIRVPNKMNESIYSAADYGVPQERRRVIIIGVNKNYNHTIEEFYKSLDSCKINRPKATVRDAIGFLPKIYPLEKPYKDGNRNVSHELNHDNSITQHDARYHSARDISVFKEWLGNNMNSYPNEQKLEFYKKITGHDTNHNKYRNIEWDKPSPTIVAHLYKDGLMFIHPDIEQLRSITIREAALLQSFPLDFEFIGSTAYCYKMIGNAVPVLFAKAIANSIIKVIGGKL